MTKPAKLLKHGLGHGPALAVVAALTLTSSALGVDAFRQLNGTEVKARFSGKELTDGVHWSMRFGNGGKLTASEAVGVRPEHSASARGHHSRGRHSAQAGEAAVTVSNQKPSSGGQNDTQTQSKKEENCHACKACDQDRCAVDPGGPGPR